MNLDALETAAADLRNAALVIEHLGHTRHIAIGPTEPRVCAVGALQLATDGKLTRTPEGVWYGSVLTGAGGGRLERAVEALADTLPSGLCPDCPPDPDHPTDRVTHFNDDHCPGGDTMATLLRIAAYRTEGIASDARKLLTGPVLVLA